MANICVLNILLLIEFYFLEGFGAITDTNALVDIDISSYNPKNEQTHSFTKYVDQVNGNLTEVVVRSNGSYSGFFIIQAHSFRHNISLVDSYWDGETIISGRNVGLLEYFRNPFVHSFLVEKLTDQNNTIIVVVTVYEREAPIPGGCPKKTINGTAESKFPTITVEDGMEIIAIKSEPPSVNGLSCNYTDAHVLVEIYHKYLHSQNFDPFEYYGAIISMLTVKDIRSNGRLVSRTKGTQDLEKLFSSYIGVGEVFAILVTINGKTSAYVPAVSYGEDINTLINQNETGIVGHGIFVVLFNIIPVVALLLIYRGHAFFHFTTFSLGLSCGTIIAFFFLSNHAASAVDDTFLIALIIGFFNGLLWLAIWYKYGFPLLSVVFAFLCTGSLVACVIFHFGVADNRNFHEDGIYWSVFFGIVITCWFMFSIFTIHGHIFSCALLGSYILMVTTFNYWMDGNLQYIVINVYRRIFVRNFNKVVLCPPLQSDILFYVCVILLTLHGFYKQSKNQRGKPPFPPHNFRGFDAEQAPLLNH